MALLAPLPLLAAAAGPATAQRPPDAVASLTAYHSQRLTWTSCRQGPDDEVGAGLDKAGAQCTNVTVPLDYSRPQGRTITIAVSKLPATDRKQRIGALFLNSGGPAEPTLGMPLEVSPYLGDLAERFDVVGIDPRFVGRSTPLDCEWPVGLWVRSAGSNRAGFDQQVAFQHDLAARCERERGDVLPYVTTRNTARDMDVIRAALGERRVSYLGYSYGAYLGAVYLQMFPGRTDRVVLDSAGDPERYGPRLQQGTEGVTENALRAWASWAAERDETYGLGDTTGGVLASVNEIVRASAREPLRVGPYRIDEHLAPVLVQRTVGSDKDDDRAVAASAIAQLHTAAEGGTVEPTPELAGLLSFILDGTSSSLISPSAAIICGDSTGPRDPEVYWRDIERSRERHPLFGPITNSIWPCAFWPESREPLTRIANHREALIVSATGDIATTYRGSQAMHRQLTGSRLLTLEDVIAHGIYGEYGNPCVDGVVNAYFASGRLPGNQTC
ncbi:alpha/beta hydrolase [Flindersiella endophytica]